MKQICPKPYETTKVKAALGPRLSIMFVLFIFALCVFAHHPHTDSRERVSKRASERARTSLWGDR